MVQADRQLIGTLVLPRRPAAARLLWVEDAVCRLADDRVRPLDGTSRTVWVRTFDSVL